MFNLILFGPPGAGKGTQAVKIAGKFQWVHVSTGDILRAEVKLKTHLGKQVQAVMDAGHLVSDALLIEIIASVFRRRAGASGFVLDGFPRTLNQATELDVMLAKFDQSVSLTLSLEVNEEELVRRLLIRASEQGRLDDTEEVIRQRLEQYHQHTKPLIEYYKKKGIFKEVYGIGGIDEIFDILCTEITQWF
jgi:adenylate kinase